MFFFFPPVELDDGNVSISLFDSRESDDGRTTNIDIVNVSTTDEDGEVLTTHFGIQGRSDHLHRPKRARKSSTKKSKRRSGRRKQRKSAAVADSE